MSAHSPPTKNVASNFQDLPKGRMFLFLGVSSFFIVFALRYPSFLSCRCCCYLFIIICYKNMDYFTIGTFLHTGLVTKCLNFFNIHSTLPRYLNNFYEHQKSIIFLLYFLLLWCDFLPSSLHFISTSTLFPAMEFYILIFYLLTDVWVIRLISEVDVLKAILITPTRFLAIHSKCYTFTRLLIAKTIFL